MKNKNNKKKKYVKNQLNNKLDIVIDNQNQILYSQKIVIKNQEKYEIMNLNIDNIEDINQKMFFNKKVKHPKLLKNIKRVKVLKNDNIYIKVLNYIKSHRKKALTTLFIILINYSTKFLDIDLTLVGILIELLF